MTYHLSLAAVQNAPLLQAIKDGGAPTPSALAEKAGIIPNHVHRKLDALEADGMIVREPNAPKHEATITQAGEAALEILSTKLIPADMIDAWPDNPRTQFSVADDETMAQSIADKGVLQPLLVRPKGERFEVLIGERRRRGAQLAIANGWRPAGFPIPCKVQDLSDDEALEIAGVENLQREDMHWMDEAKWYLRLSSRLSGAQIERLAGGQRKKRSIQDYVKCARELPAEDIARCYLPDGDANQLTYVKARDLVGEKKEKPALDLSPRVALALAELLDAGLRQHQAIELPPTGATVFTFFGKPPSGGPFAALQEKKLLAFGFEDRGAAREVAARTPVTEELRRWLTQHGFNGFNLGDVLFKLRAGIFGELQAGTYADGVYINEELNTPEPAHEPEPLPAIAPAGGGDDDDGEGDDEAPGPTFHRASNPDEATLDTLTPHQLLVLAEIRHKFLTTPYEYQLSPSTPVEKVVAVRPLTAEDQLALRPLMWGGFFSSGVVSGQHFLKVNHLTDQAATRRDAPLVSPPYRTTFLNPPETAADGGSSDAPAPRPGLEGDAWSLPPMLAIIAIELAHKIAASGVERGPGTWAVEILEAYYKDTRGMQGVQKHRAWAFLPMGKTKTLCALTKRCVEWLAQEYDLVEVGDGRLILDDELLLILQRAIVGEPKEGLYSTFWLNDPPKAEEAPAGAELPPATPAPPAAAATPSSSFSDQLRQLGAEQRTEIIGQLAAALREARDCLTAQTTRSKPDTKAIVPVVALADAALERVAALEAA